MKNMAINEIKRCQIDKISRLIGNRCR